MFTVEGASLIAQVIPVALLIIAFEGRAVAMLVRTLWRRGLFYVSSVTCVVAVVAFWAEYICISAVSQDIALDGANAIIVGCGGAAVGVWAAGFVGASIGHHFARVGRDSQG